MLNLKECERNASKLTEEELRGLSNTVYYLRYFYKYGKYPKERKVENIPRLCILCKNAERLAYKYREVQCYACPWYLLENMHCSDWFSEVYHGPSKCTISQFRHIRQPHFTAARIKMLDKWFRRLNALASRKSQGRDKFTLKKEES